MVDEKDLRCECGYAYSGPWSGRIFQEDVFFHESYLWIIIHCEGCKRSKVLQLDLKGNKDIRGDPWDYILKNKWKEVESVE